MSHQHFKGAVIPDPNDDILKSFEVFASTAGTVQAVPTIPAARVALVEAERKGHPPTPTHPHYFSIEGIIYSASGQKSGGNYVLNAPGTAEAGMVVSKVTGRIQLANRVAKELCSVKLPAVKYPRKIHVTGTLWGKNQPGKELDVMVKAHNMEGYGRLAVGAKSTMSVAVGEIPSNVAPEIYMSAVGAGGGSDCELSGGDHWTQMAYMTFPAPTT